MEVVNYVPTKIESMEKKKEKYPMFSKLISNEFSQELELSREESLELFRESLADGVYNLEKLKIEIIQALNDPAFEWVNFAISNRLVWDKDSINEDDVINYIKFYLWDFLFPEKKLEEDTLSILIQDSLEILLSVKNNDGWILLGELYKDLARKIEYANLDYYNMYYILTNSDPILLGKRVRGKKKEIIFLKHPKWAK